MCGVALYCSSSRRSLASFHSFLSTFLDVYKGLLGGNSEVSSLLID
jgi:hypothetical protein